jgi:hypothetical protein
MKRKFNESAVRYLAYQVLLESDLSSGERERLIEAGIIDKVVSWLGAGKDTAQSLGGAAMALFKSNKFNRRMVAAEKAISKEIDDLKSIAKEAGQPEEAVYGILKQILDKAGAPPAQVASPPAPPASGGGDAKGGEAPAVPAGQPLNPSKPEAAVPVLAAAAAQATGKDPEKAEEQAIEAKVDVPKATQVLAKVISQTTKVDAGKVSKIISYLIQNKHMVAESRRVISTDILMAAREISLRSNHSLVVERWNSLAGLIKEDVHAADPKKTAEAKKKFGDAFEGLRDSFKEEEMSDDEIIFVLNALDNLESIEIK